MLEPNVFTRPKSKNSVKYSEVRQSDWETLPPAGNYSTSSDTWIQASTKKCLPLTTHGRAAIIVIVTS